MPGIVNAQLRAASVTLFYYCVIKIYLFFLQSSFYFPYVQMIKASWITISNAKAQINF